jgi:glycosyltransferase involved in cell wall biosynthesis
MPAPETRASGALRVAVNALTLPKHLAGIGIYTRKLLQHLLLIEPNLEITLFTNPEAAAAMGDLGNRIRIEAVPARSIIGKAVAAQVRLPSRLGGFDLLHSVGNVGLLVSPIPQVVTIHDLCQRVFPERFGPAKRIYLNLGQGWSATRCRRIITVSQCTALDLLKHHPRAQGKTRAVHSASKYALDETPSVDRRDFLFVGTLEPGKNLEFLLEALEVLRERHGVIKTLHVVGAPGWKLSHLPEVIARRRLESQVVFAGYIDDEELRLRYRSAEALVFPSMYEGFGLPILEAQSQGCPVISADNSSLREVGGDGCRYFATRDLAGLVALLLESQSRPRDFAAIAAAGFANCRRFDWSLTASRTLEVYRECLGGA